MSEIATVGSVRILILSEEAVTANQLFRVPNAERVGTQLEEVKKEVMALGGVIVESRPLVFLGADGKRSDKPVSITARLGHGHIKRIRELPFVGLVLSRA